MTTPVRGIAALDRLAEELSAAAGVRLAVADSPAELIAAHRLRYRVARERGATTAADDRDGMERDVFDSRALQLCAWDDDILVATMRLVLPMAGKRLPVEEAFAVSVVPAGEAVEVGEPVVAPEWRGEPGRRATDGLLAQAWFETRARGYLVMAAHLSPRLAAHYRALGLDVQELGRSGNHVAVRLNSAF